MKREILLSICASFLASGALLSAATVNAISDGSPVAPAGAPRSTFVNEPGETGFGKDPFFPRTARFTRQAPKNEEGPAIVVPDFPPGLVLRGVSLIAGRKLAIINYQTVAEQEEFSIRIDGRPVKGQCVEIKEKSAVLKVNGVTKEVPLRPGL